MRPDLIASQSRKSSSSSADTISGAQPLASRSPTTFFIASQNDVDKASAAQTAHECHTARSKSVEPVAVKQEEQYSTHGVGSPGATSADAHDITAREVGPTNSAPPESERQLGGETTLQRLIRLRRHDIISPAPCPQVQTRPGERDATLQELDNDGGDVTLTSHQRNFSRTSITQPLTPLMTRALSPFDSTMPSTPKSASLGLSDEDLLTDDGCSQAIASSDEDESCEKRTRSMPTRQAVTTDSHSWAPQFVMPSLALPKRKPFTTTGRRIGRFKLCIAGASGAGKSSLIRAIVSQCEHIVHADTLATTYSATMQTSTGGASSRTSLLSEGPTLRVNEIYASTKAYPTWWTDGEESRVLRRRKSMEDVVLERNLCIVDTPGPASSDQTSPATRYVEAQLQRNIDLDQLDDNELLAVLTGGGGMQVDLVLYLIAHDAIISDEVERIRYLSELTNVLPLVGHADLLDDAALIRRKIEVLEALRSAAVRPYLLGRDTDDLLKELGSISSAASSAHVSSSGESKEEITEFPVAEESGQFKQHLPPFAISTIPIAEDTEMDASLLMKSTYSTPLSPSELPELLKGVFEPDAIQSMRHTAVRKYLLWRRTLQTAGDSRRSNSMFASDTTLQVSARRQPSRTLSTPLPRSSLLHPTTFNRAHLSRLNLNVPDLGSSGGLSDLTASHLRDHTLREGQRARLHLARWATDLQQAVQAEREQFENLVEAERAKWLLDRLGEEVRRGSVGLVDAEGITRRFVSRIDRATTETGNLRRLEGGPQPPPTSTRGKRKAALPSWAQAASRRSERRHDVGYNVKQTTSTILKLAGGSVLITAAYFLVSGLLQRPDVNLSKNVPSPSWFAPPSWVIDVMARWAWPGEGQQDIWV